MRSPESGQSFAIIRPSAGDLGRMFANAAEYSNRRLLGIWRTPEGKVACAIRNPHQLARDPDSSQEIHEALFLSPPSEDRGIGEMVVIYKHPGEIRIRPHRFYPTEFKMQVLRALVEFYAFESPTTIKEIEARTPVKRSGMEGARVAIISQQALLLIRDLYNGRVREQYIDMLVCPLSKAWEIIIKEQEDKPRVDFPPNVSRPALPEVFKNFIGDELTIDI